MKKTFLALFLITHGIFGILGFPNINISNKEKRSVPNPNEGLSIRKPSSPYLPSHITPSVKTQNLTSAAVRTNLILQKCVPVNEDALKDVYKLQIHGTIINFSGVHEKKICKGKLRYLELFALDEIVIDKNLSRVGGALQVVAIAPKIKILGERRINLNGAPGKKWNPSRALDGVHGINGKDGFAGQPGGPGGIFFALANEIENVDSLIITADGGQGGNGQDGGNGGNGIRGELPNIESLTVEEFLTSSASKWEGCTSKIKKCIVTGQEGFPGGNGGDGGKSGKGGKAGQIVLYQLHQNAMKIKKELVSDGQSGSTGMGGRGGKGGQHGGYIEMSCCEEPKKMYKEAISPVKNGTSFGPSGKNGKEGDSVFEALADPEELQGFREFSWIVNDYKKFLRSQMSDESKKERLIELYNQLITNEDINSQYGTLALLDELKGMEVQYLNLTAIDSLMFWYESLRDRIQNYKENRWEAEAGDEYANALTFAYTVAMSKANRLTKFKNDSLVINLRKFLDLIEENLNAVYEKKFDLIINKHNQVYKDQIQIKVEEVSKFIKTQIKAELVKVQNVIERKAIQLIENMNVMNSRHIEVMGEAASKVGYAHFLSKMLEKVTTVAIALASGALITVDAALPTQQVADKFLTVHEDQRPTIQIPKDVENDFREAFAIEKAYKANKLHLVMPKNLMEPQKKSENLKKNNSVSENGSKISLSNYQDEFFSILIPLLEMMKKNVLVVEELSFQSDSMVLEVSKWEVQKFLINLRKFLQKYSANFEELEVRNVLKNLYDSFNTLADIYDQIQTLNQDKQLAITSDYVNTVKCSTFCFNNKQLQEAVDEVELVERTNIALLQYEQIYKAFKQYAFPYAESYLLSLSKPSTLVLHTENDYETLIYKVKNNIQIIKQNLMEKEAFVNNHNVMTGYLSHDNQYTGPAYVWKNESYNKMISDLLDGKEVTLAPDAREFQHNAVKFKDIRFFFKTLDDSIQEDLNEKLKLFHIKMSHDGDSYYKCGKKLFVISHEAFNLTKSFEPGWGESIIVKEFSNGDFIVSPFAKWSVKLGLSQGNVPLNYFQQFKNAVDLILEVGASYVPSNHSYICDSNLEDYYHHYYRIEETIIG